MNLTDRYKAPPHVIARAVGDEMVLLDLNGGAYFGLDPVGARAWALIGEGKSLVEVCDHMIEEYDVARDELERDIMALADELVERKLIALG